MKAPVRGVFRVTGSYEAKLGVRLTGVLTAPGLPARAVEHDPDADGRWVGNDELPVAVDAADPSKFVILWDEVDPVSWESQELQAAQDLADRINAGLADAPGSGPGFPLTGAPGGQPNPVSLNAEAAAEIGAILRRELGGMMGPHGGFTPAEAARMVSSHAGEQGTAVVLDVRDGSALPGLFNPPGGMAELLLEVTRANGTVYQTRTAIGFGTPERRAAIATVGTRLRVWIDPNAPARVAIDPSGPPP